MNSTRKRWRDLSERQRAAILVLASVELSLTATAVVDLWRRPADEVKGAKPLWWPALFVQPVGPLAYLLFGRRRRS
ncbi:PLD nuclease N-terminal domain-containing protein [Streptosporangium sp. NPDC051022]|uniref:PLD nuclease N-terminal domain-containing protein n=1 Tax=Streptosporangium sp. NPDC051022 TaxID=3155752 RepID=UPI003430315E